MGNGEWGKGKGEREIGNEEMGTVKLRMEIEFFYINFLSKIIKTHVVFLKRSVHITFCEYDVIVRVAQPIRLLKTRSLTLKLY